MAEASLLEKVVSLCKRRGFVFPGSEIYGGFGGFYDYGPLGVELKNNIKRQWWQKMVYEREDVVGLDAAIIMNPKVWEASGHVEAFTDPLVECKECHSRYRVDKLLNNPRDLDAVRREFAVLFKRLVGETENRMGDVQKLLDAIEIFSERLNKAGLSDEERQRISQIINEIHSEAETGLSETGKYIDLTTEFEKQFKNSTKLHGAVVRFYLNRYEFCPNCQKINWTEPKTFNLLTEAHLGTTEPKVKAYLRGEITQGVHVNFKNVLNTTSLKIPFGIAQIGKAFRNEITPGNFIYRMREFEQMELQFYIKPDPPEADKWFEYFKKLRMEWYQQLGIRKENLRFRDHEESERAHYAQAATDIEYNAPFGWSEFEGIHHRGDWDLSRHAKYSGQDLSYYDAETKETYVPWVIETSGGVDRAALFFLLDAYQEVPSTNSGQEGRTVLSLDPRLAPYKVAVFPLVSNKPDIYNKAHEVYESLKKTGMNIAWDDRGNIGKRYYAQDEIGTPWCVTVDYQTLEDNTVTVRDRDTAKQGRVTAIDLGRFFNEKLI